MPVDAKNEWAVGEICDSLSSGKCDSLPLIKYVTNKLSEGMTTNKMCVGHSYGRGDPKND